MKRRSNAKKCVRKMPKASNDYDVKVQRVFFIDEAHRSYAKSTGEFYKNLMTCDDEMLPCIGIAESHPRMCIVKSFPLLIQFKLR